MSDVCFVCQKALDEPGICATCTPEAQRRITAAASFASRVDPEDPTRQLVEIRRLRISSPPDRYVTGDAATREVAGWCVYLLVSLGLLPDDIAADLYDGFGSFGPSEPLPWAKPPEPTKVPPIRGPGDPGYRAAMVPAPTPAPAAYEPVPAPEPDLAPTPPRKQADKDRVRAPRLRIADDPPPAPPVRPPPGPKLSQTQFGDTVATMPDDDEDEDAVS